MNKTLMNIPFSPPDISEEEIDEVVDTLKSGWITTGPKTKLFESEIAKLCGTKKAVCLNSATAALELILRVLGIGEGDEVIVPAYTYTASASPVCHVGAKLVLIDVDKDSFEMDYSQLESKITSNTKAIIAVDIAGIVADYDKIYEIVEKTKSKFTPKNDIQKLYNRVLVLADAAHAIGASRNNKMAGNIADFTSFSFHAVKNLTTGEGGAATWRSVEGLDDEALYKEFQLLSLHGQTKDALHKNQIGAWEYDIVAPLYKCNMTDVVAAIGLVQMKRYNGMLERRRKMIERYDEALKPLNVAVLNHYNEEHISSGHLYLVRLLGKTREETNKVIEKMAERGIATNVHYKPLPMMTAYKKLGFDIKNFPNAYNMFVNEVTLPLNTKMTDEDLEYVIENFVEIVNSI